MSGVDPAGGMAVRDAILDRRLGGEMIRTVRLPLTNLVALSSFLATLRLSEIELNRLLAREGAELIKDT